MLYAVGLRWIALFCSGVCLFALYTALSVLAFFCLDFFIAVPFIVDLKGLLAVEILMTDLWICCVQLPIRIVLLSIFISRSLMFHSPPFVHVVRMCVPPMVGNMLDL